MGILKGFFKFIGWIIKFSIQVFIILFFILIFIEVISDEKISSKANLVELNLNGAIIDDSEFLRQIYQAKDDSEIKGVLLRIDSPGGALAPSFEISQAIKELNDKKPVIAYASGTMASGSYLSGVWASKIYANKGSFIGSIGVIMQGANLSELTAKIGIKEQIVKAGEFKEAGTMMREWTSDEKQSLQALVDKSYELFTSEVAKARKLDLSTQKSWANARVFLADDAKKLGLIDDIKTYQEAIDLTAKTAGVANPAWKKADKLDKFINSFSTKVANLVLSELFVKVR
ncbi:signal peptide peptidase SppA [Campylobacter geochelonis]|uniref:signal peptide peptidase SppA n=1 Tax=Campylobacter geochelonis TaxID=1780362 RepID=UPI000770B687|nr:signal peptide peptidase SppA [Campylobacter geochelonis]CZE50502.1 signal peptide peptidase SppA%2C 36K type [Campylobacter geochelonis]